VIRAVTVQEAAGETLPSVIGAIERMIEGAAHSLAASTDAAKVLDVEARLEAAWAAGVAMEKMAKAQAAHDEIIRAAHKAQGDALDIKAAASKRYYEMTKQAQAAGDIPSRGGDRRSEDFKVSDQNFENPAQHKAVAHEGKQIATAEELNPGVVRRTIDKALNEGRAPTKADIKRAISPSMKKRADGDERIRLDKRDFKAFCKLWRTMSDGAKAQARAFIGSER